MDKLLIVIAVLGVLALVFFAIKEGLDSTTKETSREQIEKFQREVAERDRQLAEIAEENRRLTEAAKKSEQLTQEIKRLEYQMLENECRAAAKIAYLNSLLIDDNDECDDDEYDDEYEDEYDDEYEDEYDDSDITTHPTPNSVCKASDFEAFVTAYNSLTCDATIEKCENCRPYTAALLFTVSDGILSKNSNYQTRKLLADKIFAFIENEKHFSQSELEIFDSAVLLYGKVINNTFTPRGDWQVAMSSGSASDWLEKLFLCYGDLLKNPDYIHNYESAPVFIDDMDNAFRFAMALSAKEPLVIEYATKISNL